MLEKVHKKVIPVVLNGQISPIFYVARPKAITIDTCVMFDSVNKPYHLRAYLRALPFEYQAVKIRNSLPLRLKESSLQ